jgi:hypothetical protein
MTANLWIVHTDAVNAPNGFWERGMLTFNYVSTTGREGRPALEQIKAIKAGDIVVLNRNNNGGILALSAVIKPSVAPEQYDNDNGVKYWIRTCPVEKWDVLLNPLPYSEYVKCLTRSEKIFNKTINPVLPPDDEHLFDLFYSTYAVQKKNR